MINRSRSALFLLEQLIVITVFAVCAAACVKIFVVSYIMTNDTRDMNNALLKAESGAECYKAAGGDAEIITEVLDGSVLDNSDMIYVYYNNEWDTCGKEEAAYVMRLALRTAEPPAALSFGDISVEKITGAEIIAFTVSARSGGYE